MKKNFIINLLFVFLVFFIDAISVSAYSCKKCISYKVDKGASLGNETTVSYPDAVECGQNFPESHDTCYILDNSAMKFFYEADVYCVESENYQSDDPCTEDATTSINCSKYTDLIKCNSVDGCHWSDTAGCLIGNKSGSSYNIIPATDENGTFIDTKAGTCMSSLGILYEDLNSAFNVFKIVAPLLVILYSIYDYVTAIFSKDAEGMKKANKKFIIRLVLIVVLYFLPVLLNMLLEIIDPAYSSCIG